LGDPGKENPADCNGLRGKLLANQRRAVGRHAAKGKSTKVASGSWEKWSSEKASKDAHLAKEEGSDKGSSRRDLSVVNSGEVR